MHTRDAEAQTPAAQSPPLPPPGICDASPDYLFLYDLDERCLVYGNRRCAEFFGIQPRSPFNVDLDRVRERVHPDSQAALDLFLEQLAQLGPDETAETLLCMRNNDDEWRWLRIVNSVYAQAPDAQPRSVCGSATDITDHRRIEQALEQSEQLHRTVLDHQVDGTVLVVDGKIIYANPAIGRMWNRDPSDFIGQSPACFTAPEDMDRARARVAELVAGGPEFPSMYTAVRQGGERFTTEMHTRRIDYRGRPALLSFVRDVTERLRQEEHRQKLEAGLSAAEKLEAVGTLASGVAHEFNNMIMAINGFNDLAQRCVSPDDPIAEYLRRIGQICRQAAGVTRGLLTFARKPSLQNSPVALHRVMHDAQQLLGWALPAAIKIELKTDPSVGEREVWVRGDAGQIQRLLVNLAINARDAMPEGGRFVLSLAIDADEEPAIADDADPTVAVITVSDNGIGMSKDVAARVFEPFFTTKPRGRGTGLGLAVAHGIVVDHDGRIDLESTPGRGTTFRITLPLCEPADEETDPTYRTTVCVGPSRNILVAEDDDFVREAIRGGLTAMGFDVFTTGNGVDSRHLVQDQERPLHLVVIDLDQPAVSGHAVLSLIGEHRPDLPILVISGEADHTVDDLVRAGALLLSKPFTIEDLANACDRLLRSPLGSDCKQETSP